MLSEAATHGWPPLCYYRSRTLTKRASISPNTPETNLTLPDGDVLLETDAGGDPLVSYTLANGQLISQVRDGLPSYYLTDGQGSVRVLVDGDGAITDTYTYTAFGEMYAQTGATENSYLYTGQQFDDLTGLYSLRARYYDPGLGRFLSQDTAGVLYGNPVELNRYVYTANDPVNHLDPSGLLAGEVGEIYKEDVKTATSFGAKFNQAIGRVVWMEYEARLLGMMLPGSFLEIKAIGLGIALLIYILLTPHVVPEPTMPPAPEPLPVPTPRTEPKPDPQETPSPTDQDVCVEGDPRCDDESQSVITIFHTLGGKKNNAKTRFTKPNTSASEFKIRVDGVSAFELPYLPGNKPYAIGFDVSARKPVIVGDTKSIIGLPCVATFDNSPPGHWDIVCTPKINTDTILSGYAKGFGKRRIILNPYWTGEPKDRRLP